MDAFHFDNVKAEKANAMLRYRRLRKIANLFRFFEVCLALILLSWLSTRLPTALRISGKYFQQLCIVLVSPRFVFFVGNAIIITLFAKSGLFSFQNADENTAGTDLYDDFIKSSENFQKIRVETPSHPEKEIAFQDKQTLCEEKIYQRSKSENLKHEKWQKPRRELNRSETEKCRQIETSIEKPAVTSDTTGYDISNEELRRKIEAFIARQQRLQREEEESTAIVIH